MEFINEGWFGILAGATIAIVTAIVSYRKSIKEPVLSYYISMMEPFFMTGPIEVIKKLKVHYDNVPVENLTVLTVVLWNSGNAVLEGSALVPRDPLRVVLSQGGKVVIPEIARNPNPQCNIELQVDPEDGVNFTSIRVHFDFLNPGQGVALRVLHLTRTNAAYVSGSLKGVTLRCASPDVEARRRELGDRFFGKRRLPLVFGSFVVLLLMSGLGAALDIAWLTALPFTVLVIEILVLRSVIGVISSGSEPTRSYPKSLEPERYR